MAESDFLRASEDWSQIVLHASFFFQEIKAEATAHLFRATNLGPFETMCFSCSVESEFSEQVRPEDAHGTNSMSYIQMSRTITDVNQQPILARNVFYCYSRLLLRVEHMCSAIRQNAEKWTVAWVGCHVL